jgi:hypothetical protein
MVTWSGAFVQESCIGWWSSLRAASVGVLAWGGTHDGIGPTEPQSKGAVRHHGTMTIACGGSTHGAENRGSVAQAPTEPRPETTVERCERTPGSERRSFGGGRETCHAVLLGAAGSLAADRSLRSRLSWGRRSRFAALCTVRPFTVHDGCRTVAADRGCSAALLGAVGGTHE